MTDIPKRRFLGIEIAEVSIAQAVEAATSGGLVLAPSGPGLCDLAWDLDYRRALEKSDMNLADSGLAILLSRFLGLGKLPRTSGLGFLEALLNRMELKKTGATFWVMPSPASLQKNLHWLESRGLNVDEANCYIAPIYPKTGTVCDEALLERLQSLKPPFIFICTGSGTQEKLGLWLREKLNWKPTICCIGAAIGFLSGDQVRIPAWADRMCLGWLLRCLSSPRKFIPRYCAAMRLVFLAIRYRDKPPPLRAA
jgi:N-acetylglucosaminyldiphosphoundecaprenol N-acetyl-beta-D-mannosaminyltransferase